MEENQIVVASPVSDVVNGITWEYSLDNSTWQESNVFDDYNGQPFVDGQTYPVYAALNRGTPYERRAFIDYTFGLTNKKVTLDVAAKNGRRTSEVLDAFGFEAPDFEEDDSEVEFVLTEKLVITDNIPRKRIKKKKVSKLLDFPSIMTFMEGDEVVISRNEGGIRKNYRISPELLSGWTGGSAVPAPPSGGIPTQTLTEGVAYIYELVAWNNANEYEVKDLPAGLTFNNATRRIFGTPTTSGNYIVTVTGISAAGIRKGIAVGFTVQAASISRDLEGLSFARTGTNLKWTLQGEGGPEGVRIKQGTDEAFTTAPYFDMVKVANRKYEFTYQGVTDGNYTVRAELKIGTGAIQEEFTLEEDNQTGIVFPGQINLFTGKTAQVSSGDDQEKINNLNLTDAFATDSELQPCIGFTGLEDEGQKARHRVSYINTDHPEDFQGAFIMAGENLSIQSGTFQQNFNQLGIWFYQIPIDATSPIKVEVGDFQSSQIIAQRSDTGQLRLNEWQDFGDYPVVNHAPVINTIPDILRTEGQAMDYDTNGFVSDVDGDTTTKVLTLAGGFALPSWMAYSDGHILVSALPWEGGSVATIFEYNLVLVATDEHGSATTQAFKLKVQRVGTLASLNSASVHYDYLSSEKRLAIGADVVDSGPMRVNIVGAGGTTYGGSGWKAMANGSTGDFPSGTNKLLNAASPDGFSGVLPGSYEIQFQEYENGPVLSRALTIPSSNIPNQEVYKKADTGSSDPSISSISQTLDSNGKPIINAVVLNAPNGVEIAIVQLSGEGWNTTAYGAATLVSGASNYQRAYTTVAPAGSSYRYDVRIIGTSIVQSGVFTIATPASNYFLQVDWADGGAGFLDLRAQVTDLTGVKYKFSTETSLKTAVYNSGMTNLLAGAKAYQLLDLVPTSTSARTIQFQKVGTDQFLNVTIPAGGPPQDGQWHPIYTADLLVKAGGYLWDSNNQSATTYFELQTAGKQLQMKISVDSGATEKGTNNGSNNDAGTWQTEVWYDLIADTSIAGFSYRRRFYKGTDPGATGLLAVAHTIQIREKNTEGPIQTIGFTPSATGGFDTHPFAISAATGGTGGGTTPTPVVGAKIMLLGDSLMTDQVMRTGLKAGLDSASILASLVGSIGAGTVSDPRHEGHVGYTIAQMTSGVAGWINASSPDIIVLMIGTNNANNGAYDLSNVPAEYGALIDTIFATKSNVKLIVSNIPPRTDDTFNARVTTLNGYIPTVVASRAASGRVLQYVGAASSINRATDMSDGTHLNVTGSGKLANGFLAGIQSLGTLVPGVSARLAPIREVYAVKHTLSWSGDMADLKDEFGVGFDEGLLTGCKITLTYHDAVDSAAWTAFKNFYTWVRITKGKKCAIHLDMKFDKNHAYPSVMNDNTAEIYTSNGGTEQYYYTPSMSQNDGFLAWRANGTTTNWNNNTAKKILYDTFIPRIVELEAIAPIWFVAQGRTHTGEGGYNSRVDTLENAMFGGNEQSERDAFRAWLYVLGGGTLLGVRILLGNQTLTHEQLVPPTPSRSSFDSFWSTFKGGGLKQAYFEFRSRRVDQDQKMFEWYIRNTNPNIPVAFECGAFTGNQATINGTTEVLTIGSTADLVKENPTWGDNWSLKADIGRGLKSRFSGDGDGSLRRSNGMWANGGYVAPGIYSDREIAIKMVKLSQGNGYLGVFGDIRNFYYPLRLIKNDRTVAPAGLIGSDFVTIYPSSTITYSSEEYRDPGSSKSLNSYAGPFANIVQINNPWPLAA
jgi:lysophospholipase L1-like esterase